ncbi:MAG TPA: ABC transporter ATP-binding protein, partial [Devosia sp.]
VEALGSDVLVHFAIDAEAATVQSSDSLQEIKATANGSRMVARFSPKSAVRLGAPVTVAPDLDRLQFFDPATGDAIWG